MGTLFKKRGAWYIDYYAGGRRIRKKIGRSKRVAQIALADAELAATKNELGIALTDRHIDDFFAEYGRYARTNLAPSSVKRYQAVIDHFNQFLAEHHAGVRKLSHLSPGLVEKYKIYRSESPAPRNGIIPKDRRQAQAVKNGAAAKTINTELIALKAIFNVAVKWNYLRENPARGVKALREVKVKTPRFLSQAEIKTLLKRAPADFKPVLQTFLYTGLRKAELANLEWADVDFERGVIHVRAKAHWRPKSSEREVPLHQDLREVLLKLRKRGGAGLVFCTRDGNPLRKIRERFIVLTKRCGMEDVTKVHALRHTFASHLVMAGVPLPTVQKLMGHSDIQTTMIYAHLSGDHIRQAVGKLPY
jgi:integrase